MRKNNGVFLVLTALAIVLGASSFLFHSSASLSENSTCCKKPLNKCSAGKSSDTRQEMIIDNLSRQFISTGFSVY